MLVRTTNVRTGIGSNMYSHGRIIHPGQGSASDLQTGRGGFLLFKFGHGTHWTSLQCSFHLVGSRRKEVPGCRPEGPGCREKFLQSWQGRGPGPRTSCSFSTHHERLLRHSALRQPQRDIDQEIDSMPRLPAQHSPS